LQLPGAFQTENRSSTLTRLDHRLAIEHAKLAAVRIKIVQARFEQPRARAVGIDADIVL
jgi:hypothetical protein